MPRGQAPSHARPGQLSGYLEALARAVFQGGISWQAVEAKWPDIRQAFDDLEPRRVADLDAEHGGFRRYLRSHGSFEATVADLKRQFRFLGDTGSYYFLSVVGEEVPSHDEWSASRSRASRAS